MSKGLWVFRKIMLTLILKLTLIFFFKLFAYNICDLYIKKIHINPFYYFIVNWHVKVSKCHLTVEKDSVHGGGRWTVSPVFSCSGSRAWSGGGDGNQQASSWLMGTNREQRRGTSLAERAASDAIMPASCTFSATGQHWPCH